MKQRSVPGRRRRSPGFTLIEALMALAVAALLLGLAAADLSPQAADAAAAADAAVWMADLRYARDAALTRGEVVSLCAREPGAGPLRCRPAAGAVDWSGGWLVFVDRDPRGQFDAGDQLLRQHEALAAGGAAPGSRAVLSFGAAGTSLSAASHLRFQPRRLAGGVAARLVCVSKQGRARLASRGAGGCT